MDIDDVKPTLAELARKLEEQANEALALVDAEFLGDKLDEEVKEIADKLGDLSGDVNAILAGLTL
jgi:hypothetical protein